MSWETGNRSRRPALSVVWVDCKGWKVWCSSPWGEIYSLFSAYGLLYTAKGTASHALLVRETPFI